MERSSGGDDRDRRAQRPRRRASGDGEARRVGGVVRQTVTAGGFAEGLLLGRLVRGWQEVAGPELAGRSRPAALEARGLLIAAESAAWAARVRFTEAEIRRRANLHLGREAVARVRVVVGPPEPRNT
ncbi:MAG TPA: DciA family protein [Actinomycetota bacterium]|nr:DciA family protein [Actinomycetota bacterium]